TLTVLALCLTASVPDAAAQKKGGVLKVGNLGEPPTLDAHWTTATITEVLAQHIYEGLYSLDARSQPIPMLAEGMPAVSKDGLTYTFKLRQGIKFHNGKEAASGYGGRKIAYVNELLWIPVPDAATRVAQIETGELDFADDLDLNAYERLKNSPGVQAIVAKPYYWLVAVFNKKEGLMTNQ